MQRIAVFSAGLCCALLLSGCGAPSGAASAAPEPISSPAAAPAATPSPAPALDGEAASAGTPEAGALPRCACALAGAFCRCGPRAV